MLVPAALSLGLALNSGGFFPNSVSVAVIAVLLVLAGRTLVGRRPFAFTFGFGAIAVTLVVFVVWTLVSGSWSGASARATFEYDRALLYAAVFVLAGILGRSRRRAQGLLWGLTAVFLAISSAATLTWLLPDLIPVGSAIARDRLAWPTSYWNATGLIAALALVWSCSLSFSASQPPRVRALAAAAVPLPAAALIFTVSRGALAVAIVGLIVSVAMIRSSATLGGIIAAVPAIAVSTVIALGVSRLNVTKPSPAAIAAGHRSAVLLVAVTLATGALRIALLRLDSRLAGRQLPWTRNQFLAGLLATAAVIAVGFVALGGPHVAARAVHNFVAPETESVGGTLAASQRLTRLGNNGRIQEWTVAWKDGFLPHPVLGVGAGTYATLWTRYGTLRRVLNAHSLYLETLAELGIVGAGLLFTAIASVLVALGRRARGTEREVWAALLAGGVMWAVHAGVDWDWQMPAVTAWFFAAGGLALSAPADRSRPRVHPRIRVGIALGCLLLAVTPAVVWRSQTQLIQAVNAFEQGDCVAAERHALASNSALGSRSDPLEVISYCEAAAGHLSSALSAIQAAEQRDPRNWELPYSNALISAAAGVDPRPSARTALRFYPRSPLALAAVRAFSRGGPPAWRRFALAAPLPLPRSHRR